MRKSVQVLIAATVLATCPHAAQSAPGDGADRNLAGPTSATPAGGGRPENRWRYRFSQGRWWYWTTANQWSYFDGARWTTAGAASRYGQKVDPALLRLEAKEGLLGRKKWPKGPSSGGGGGLPMSGTQGTAGGNPSGSFTDPGGVPSAVNTTTGSFFGYGERIAVPPRKGR